jgi:hypothetical protein
LLVEAQHAETDIALVITAARADRRPDHRAAIPALEISRDRNAPHSFEHVYYMPEWTIFGSFDLS